MDPLVVILGGVFVVGFILLAARGSRLLRAIARRITCPGSGKPVDVVGVYDSAGGRWVDVKSCSVFRRPEDVRCAKRCLETLNAGPSSTVAHR
jgi:hypothetical protein